MYYLKLFYLYDVSAYQTTSLLPAFFHYTILSNIRSFWSVKRLHQVNCNYRFKYRTRIIMVVMIFYDFICINHKNHNDQRSIPGQMERRLL
jgi:hypothetical protein